MFDQTQLALIHYCSIALLSLALLLECVLFRHGLTMVRVRRLLLVDGVAALALFAIFISGAWLAFAHAGSLGAIFSHATHGVKSALFLLMVASLDYPSRLFYHWRRALRQGKAPMISSQQYVWVMWILRGNLLLIALLALLLKLLTR